MYKFDDAIKADVKEADRQTKISNQGDDSDQALTRLSCDVCSTTGDIHLIPGKYRHLYKCNSCGKVYHSSIIMRMLLAKSDEIRSNTKTGTNESHHLLNEPEVGAELNFGTNDRY